MADKPLLLNFFELVADTDRKIGSGIGDQKKRQSMNLDSIVERTPVTFEQYGPEMVAFALSRGLDMAGDKAADAAAKGIAKGVVKPLVEKNGYKALSYVSNIMGIDDAIDSLNRVEGPGIKNTSEEFAQDKAKNMAKDKLDDIASEIAHGDIDKGLKKGTFVPKDTKQTESAKNKVLRDAKNAIKGYDEIAKFYKTPGLLPETKAKMDELAANYAKRYAYSNTGKLRNKSQIARMAQRDPDFINALKDLQLGDWFLRNDIHADKAAESFIKAGIPLNATARTGLRTLYGYEGSGKYDKSVGDWDFIDFDPRLEKGKLWHLLQNLLEAYGANYLGSNRINREEARELVKILNNNELWGKFKNRFQMAGLSDWELVQFIMDASAGKYDTEDTKLSEELVEARKKQKALTNNKETK